VLVIEVDTVFESHLDPEFVFVILGVILNEEDPVGQNVILVLNEGVVLVVDVLLNLEDSD